ncbi:MAG: polysaccharide biosynthesis protein [Bacteroidaceae bacterium]|jgi:FlaA1/EpsC-like NDP-sugar epimerase|nr:polysaccharide biosynthesis protein [Bacteroidaceae bacterium]
MKIFSSLLNWYFSRNAMPYWCILIIDYLIIIFCGYLAYYLFNGGEEVTRHFWPILWDLCILLVPYTIAFRIFHTYSGIFRYSSFVDLGRLALAMLVGSVIAFIGYQLFPTHHNIFLEHYPRLILLLMFATSFMCAARVVVKTLYDLFRTGGYSKRIFIYGAQDGGVSLAKSIRNETPNRYTIKGFISPDPSMKGKWLLGLPVYSEEDNIVELMRKQDVGTLMVSPLQTVHFREQETLVNDLIAAGIRILMLPSAKEWDGKSELRYNQLHEVDIEDLLPRDKIEVDMIAIGRQLNASRILITGAAGSIGSEMVHQVAHFEPKEMVLIDQAETPMHDVRRMMASQYPNIPCHTIVASITNKTFMEDIFRRFRPEYVFHAAAYKHVPMMEDNPAMAVQNNVYGTRIIADLAVKYGTKKFVMISTDKAVNPTNVMGCSKRICEIYCQSLNKAIEKMKQQGEESTKVNDTTDNSLLQANGNLPCTQFVTTRFGNVLGSNGSVIPIFREQIAKGGPVTVTHPDIIRYFMLIPEACKLVLEAGTMGKGGEIFVFDMGKPVRIANLAQRMITLSGAKGCKIEFTGLRDGEKLYEEVLNDAEHTLPTMHPKIMVAKVREYDYEQARRNEERLLEASYSYDDMAIVRIMKEIVPEFKSRQSKYEALD